MKHNWYGQAGGGLIGALWTANALKAALMKPTFVPDRDNQLTWAAVSAQEVTPMGPYVAGGQLLANKHAVYDAPNDRMNLQADDTSWGPGFTIDSAFAVVYDSTTGILWSLVDFEATRSVVNGTFTIDWQTVGLLYTQAL